MTCFADHLTLENAGVLQQVQRQAGPVWVCTGTGHYLLTTWKKYLRYLHVHIHTMYNIQYNIIHKLSYICMYYIHMYESLCIIYLGVYRLMVFPCQSPLNLPGAWMPTLCISGTYCLIFKAICISFVSLIKETRALFTYTCKKHAIAAKDHTWVLHFTL